MAEYLKDRHLESLPKEYKNKSKYARSLCYRLQKLECPFTESVDETWIIELVFKPGEPRIRILQWLLSKFHKSLYNFLDPIYSRTEVKIKAILHVAASLGLCRPTDIELIEGNASWTKQVSFMDKLLDMVIISDSSESSTYNSPSKFTIRDSTEIQEQFRRDSSLVDNLTKKQPLDQIFPPSVSILPVDIKKSLEGSTTSTDRENRALPDLQQLTERAAIAQEELEKQSEVFRQLQQEHTITNYDESVTNNALRKMRLLLSELHQVMVSYSYCYENHIQPWCSRDAPELSKLGDKITSVHRLLNNFTTVLGSLKVIRSSHDRIESTVAKTKSQPPISSSWPDLDKLFTTLSELEKTLTASYS